MEITKRKSNFASTFDYFFKQDNKILKIRFGGNLDLYWSIYNLGNKDSYDKSYEETLHETFIITKENYFIYKLFEELINDIKEVKVYKDDYTITNKNNLYKDNLEIYKQLNEKLKRNYRYEMLYDGKSITWHSDEEPYDIANTVRISKVEDNILLEFTRPPLKLKDQLFDMRGTISIHFRNSGSTYEPFNVIFMRMYHKLQEYNPDYHQIHIEEINYKKRVKK